MFQSLGRDSVHSSPDGARSACIIISFQSLGRDSVHSSYAMQICKVPFCVGFNPSVGILFIQAYTPTICGGRYAWVSIPRSGFCSFKHNRHCIVPVRIWCFNPSVGILFIQALTATWSQMHFGSFNPSVGILFIQARAEVQTDLCSGRFQSLGRDSVHSSVACTSKSHYIFTVSIPRSGFCSFKRRYVQGKSI